MKEVAELVVKLMAASARTAPKAGGKDFLEAARALGLIRAEVAMGIPVSISGKSIYFDRKVPGK
jgi:uncharacterized ferredoxin-like protein